MDSLKQTERQGQPSFTFLAHRACQGLQQGGQGQSVRLPPGLLCQPRIRQSSLSFACVNKYSFSDKSTASSISTECASQCHSYTAALKQITYKMPVLLGMFCLNCPLCLMTGVEVPDYSLALVLSLQATAFWETT